MPLFKKPSKALGPIEFIILMALIMSLTALSIDSILPALAIIGEDFQLSQAKDTQFIIVILFFGMAFGQFFYGPLADSIGRKPCVYIGIGIFLLGSLFSIFAHDLNTMLVGRFLQGAGVASTRIVTTAIIRDSFRGKYMARIMSFMMSIFVLIPIIAPTLGYWILSLTHWRMIYVFTAIYSLFILAWFSLRQEETLKPKFQQAFSLSRIWKNTLIIFKYQSVIGYTVMSGLIFGAFLGYLSSSQYIFQNIYQTGNNFPYYFAALATALGIASFLNGKWVVLLGPKLITRYALIGIIIISSITLAIIYISNSSLTLNEAMIYFISLFFLVGLLFGNLNALAMYPIGHLAGIGAGVIGSLSTFISIPLANLIGHSIDNNINNFILGFLLCALGSLLIMFIIEKNQHHQSL